MSGADQYLLAVYIESERSGAPVSSGTVADRLHRSPSSVREIRQRLDDRELLVYKLYKWVTLTAAGRDRLADLHESHVTLSWLFRSALELERHESEAMELAEVLDPSVAAHDRAGS